MSTPRVRDMAPATARPLAIISFDPGTLNLGGAAVIVDPRCADPCHLSAYGVLWLAVWNLNEPLAKNDPDPTGETFSSLRALQLTRLNMLLAQCVEIHALLCGAALGLFDLQVVIEQQEGTSHGGSDARLERNLQPCNAVLGALFTFFAQRGVPVDLVNKQCKWGYPSLGRAATKDFFARLLVVLMALPATRRTRFGQAARAAVMVMPKAKRNHPADAVFQGCYAGRRALATRGYTNALPPVLLKALGGVLSVPVGASGKEVVEFDTRWSKRYLAKWPTRAAASDLELSLYYQLLGEPEPVE